MRQLSHELLTRRMRKARRENQELETIPPFGGWLSRRIGHLEYVMRNTFFRFCSIVLLMTFASLGCSTVSRPKASAEDCSVKVGLQLQKASSLSAGRYTMLLDALQRSTVDEARNDIDYWRSEER